MDWRGSCHPAPRVLEAARTRWYLSQEGTLTAHPKTREKLRSEIRLLSQVQQSKPVKRDRMAHLRK